MGKPLKATANKPATLCSLEREYIVSRSVLKLEDLCHGDELIDSILEIIAGFIFFPTYTVLILEKEEED